MKCLLPILVTIVWTAPILKTSLLKQQPCNATGVWVTYEDEFDDIEKKIKDPQRLSVEEIEMRIRKKGSITLSLVDTKENLNDPANTLYNMTYSPPRLNYNQLLMLATSNDPWYIKQAIKTQAELPPRNKNSIYYDDEHKKNNLFLLSKMEMPYFCQVRLTQEEKVGLAQNGPALLKCWLSQNPQQNLTFVQLPYLCASQISSFYGCAMNVIGADTPALAKKDSQSFMASLLWGNLFRDRMSWLDFMGYLCSRGVKEKDYDYVFQGPLTTKDKARLANITALVNANAQALLPRPLVQPKKLIYMYKGMGDSKAIRDMTRFKQQLRPPLNKSLVSLLWPMALQIK